jgi:competence ComEA-like helix-hairpin-helix protein
MRIIGLQRFTCLFLFVFFLLTVGMTVSAEEEEESLVGKTVNINTATAEEFASNVPLIDVELAEKIVEYREETGDFQVLEELLQIDGFTRKLLRRIKPFLLLEGLGGDECTC